MDFSMSMVDTLARQASSARLRQIGLNDPRIAEAMKVVCKIKPAPLSTKDQQKMGSFVRRYADPDWWQQTFPVL
jgi:hypothetical protein